jgi:hypothetical protein
MSGTLTITQENFERLLEEHRELIQLAQQLEFQLYRLGEGATAERVGECQQVAGSLIGLLRANLFRHDQNVLPVLESLITRQD